MFEQSLLSRICAVEIDEFKYYLPESLGVDQAIVLALSNQLSNRNAISGELLFLSQYGKNWGLRDNYPAR